MAPSLNFPTGRAPALTGWFNLKYYQGVIDVYEQRNLLPKLRERFMTEWTTLAVVDALLVSLMFTLFTTGGAYGAGKSKHDASVNCYAMCSGLALLFLTGSLFFVTLFLINGNTLFDEEFGHFLRDHVNILLLPAWGLLGGVFFAMIAIMAYGFIAYSDGVAITMLLIILAGLGTAFWALIFSINSRARHGKPSNTAVSPHDTALAKGGVVTDSQEMASVA